MSEAKNVSPDGKDRDEWNRRWREMPHRRLPSPPEISIGAITGEEVWPAARTALPDAWRHDVGTPDSAAGRPIRRQIADFAFAVDLRGELAVNQPAQVELRPSEAQRKPDAG